jgi:hypothetical protein
MKNSPIVEFINRQIEDLIKPSNILNKKYHDKECKFSRFEKLEVDDENDNKPICLP